MTNKKSSLKSGLVFSAAVAGSILGNYHRAYSLSCTSVTNNPAFGRLDTCDGTAGTQNIAITGDFTINGANNNGAAVKVFNKLIADTDNSVSVTLSSRTIASTNASGFSLLALQGNVDPVSGYGGVSGGRDNDFSLTINENVSINTTSDGNGGSYNFQEAISINNSSNQGSNTLVINGDVTTRGSTVVGTPGFDDAIRVYKFGTGETNITIGESSTIEAYDGGDALYSYGGHSSDVVVNISGDIYSEEGSAVVVLKGDSSIQTVPGSAGNMTVNIDSTSTINSKKDAVFLFISETNTQDADAKTINLTVSGDINSSEGNTISIDGSSRFDGKRDTLTVTAGANLTRSGDNPSAAVINVKDNFSTINLQGGTNFASTNAADIVKISNTSVNSVFAIKLASSTLQTSIHDDDVADHVTDFTDAADHPTIGMTAGVANHTVNVSGNVEISGDIDAGGDGGVGDNDILNLDKANLTLSGDFSVGGFESIQVLDDSALTLKQGAVINTATAIEVSAGKSLDLSLKDSGLRVNQLIGVADSDVVTFNNQNDRFTIEGSADIAGNVNGGEGIDTLNLSGAVLALLNGATFRGFEDLNISGTNQITGAFSVSAATVDLSAGSSLSVANGIQGVNGSAVAMTIAGATITSDGGINFANQNDSLTISGTSAITGNVDGGAGSDSLNLSGTNLTLNGGATFSNFENLNISGTNQITGAFNVSAANVNLSAGSLAVANGIQGVNGNAVAMTINGATISSANGVAINFANQNDSLTISGTSAITGNVNGGLGIDTLNLNAATLTLNNTTFNDFENLNISGVNQINGTFNVSAATVGLGAGSSLTVGGIQGTNDRAVAMTIAGAALVSTNGINFANQNDSLTISGTSEITGNVDGGAGSDTLNLSGTVLTLNNGVTFNNFENLNISGSNIVNGNLNLSGFSSLNNAQDSVIEVNGIVTAAALNLNDGFTLNGNLTLNGDLTANDGSTLSAGATGSGIGTMTVNGDITFNQGSTLVVDVNGDNSDEIIVNGNVNINNGANLVVNPVNGGSGSGRIFQVNNGTITGNFTGNFSNILATSGDNITLVYSANSLNFNYVSLNTGVLSSQIQSSVDNSILFSDTLNKQITRGAFGKGRNVWVRNIYRNRDIDGSSSAAGFTDRAYGIAFGGETDVNESVKVGFAAASIDSDVNVANNQGGSNGNSYFASAYTNYKTNNNLFASLALTLGYHDNKNTRLVNNGGVQSYAKSETGNKDIGLNFQVGKKYSVKEVWNIMPKFSLSYIRTMAGNISESGAGNSQISVKSYDFSTLKFREALRVERSNYFKFSKIEFSPYFELGLAQERTIGDRKISGSFVAANQGFSTKLRNNNRNFVTGNVGFNMQINKDVSAFVSYENAVSSQETRNDLNAGVSVKF